MMINTDISVKNTKELYLIFSACRLANTEQHRDPAAAQYAEVRVLRQNGHCRQVPAL